MLNLNKILTTALVLFSMKASATILPPNDLWRFDNVHSLTSNISEAQFNNISDTIIAVYQPMARSHGANLSVAKNWTDSTVNAYADESGNNWNVNMFGGLARRDEMTPDGFALVVCHELGHHFGGYFFYSDSDWAAAEGQADYFATQVCARKAFAKLAPVQKITRKNTPVIVQQKCDAVWSSTADRTLCYRTVVAGKALADLLGALGGTKASYETTDSSKVGSSQAEHPAAQCRLDTYFNGALCTKNADDMIIPGKNQNSRNSSAAENEARKQSCFTSDGFRAGTRPLCWFKPLM